MFKLNVTGGMARSWTFVSWTKTFTLHSPNKKKQL